MMIESSMSNSPLAAQQTAFPVMLSVPLGLPGFPDVTDYCLEQLSTGSASLFRLTAADELDLSFILFSLSDESGFYAQSDVEAYVGELGIDAAKRGIFAFLSIRQGDELEYFLNLRAPLVVDFEKQVANQFISREARYPLRMKVAL